MNPFQKRRLVNQRLLCLLEREKKYSQFYTIGQTQRNRGKFLKFRYLNELTTLTTKLNEKLNQGFEDFAVGEWNQIMDLLEKYESL